MFFGRTKELVKLNGIIDSDRATIGVIFGRRRIGKSELIKKAFTNKQVLIFEGLENRPKAVQIDAFLIQLAYQTNQEIERNKVKSWREAFIILFDYLKDNPAHLAFDEFQWMANYRHEIVSFMIAKVLKSKALYGRPGDSFKRLLTSRDG